MIVSLGDAVVDLVAINLASLPEWGEDREVSSIEMRLGGSALHVATNLAALGNEVALLAGVGRDAWGEFLTAGVARAGAHVAGMKQLAAPTAVTMVLSGPSDRAFVSVYGATATFSREDLDRSLLAKASHVHVGGLWQSRMLGPHLPALFDELRKHGTTVSLDTNYDATDSWGEPLPALLDRIDLFLPSETEAMRITRKGTPDQALASLAERVPLVVMKMGAEGARAQRGEQRWAVPAIPVEVVDTTGAGDGFNAGFLHGWVRGWTMERVLHFATATGAMAVNRVGASEGAPDIQEVEEFIYLREDRKSP